MTLVEFLRARLEEDEAAARHAAGRLWRTEASEAEDVFVLTEDDEYVVGLWNGGNPSGGAAVDDAEHIARHGPARVLAEVEAKRQIMRAHDREHHCTQMTGAGQKSVVDGQPWEFWEDEHTGNIGGPCYTLRLLAQPYADHPDYDPAWRP